MLFHALFLLFWRSTGRKTENTKQHELECMKLLLCKRSLITAERHAQGIPPFQSQMGSGAQIAEHSKSRGIIIKAAHWWTLMAAPVPLPWHVWTLHWGLEGVNTWMVDKKMNLQEHPCFTFRTGCMMDSTGMFGVCKWLCLHSVKPTKSDVTYEVISAALCILFQSVIFTRNIINETLKMYELNPFCHSSRNMLCVESVDVPFQQPLDQWWSLTGDFVLIYLHLKSGWGDVVYLFQYWDEGIGETVVAAFRLGDGLLKLMRSGWITGLIVF